MMPQFPEKTWVRDGLVSYWPLDNEQLVGSPPGATVRDVIGGNDGVTSGTITTGVTGKINEAFDFDGGDDYIAIKNLHYNTVGEIPELTVSAWVKIPTNGGNWSIVDFDRSEYYTCCAGVPNDSPWGEGGYVGFHTTDDGGTTHDMWNNSPVRDGTWHHIAWVFDSSLTNDKKIYVDGELDAEADQHGAGSNIGTGTTRYGFIGDGSEANSFDGGRNAKYYQGTVDEVIIFDRALTQTEVKALYRRGVAYPW